ncbi:cytochrome C biosynthesis protein [Lottiidibacillus patelloidae]|uniref:Cytochrome C biosynthesis protein n=1 Tax=Lottiidibacillus patelloidae TaxID=2670334 RepID=A0A263BUK0_9BACI|nr:sulfite exporter TauE/SafE family protein [Lottiidibacillus patelloidae]OZM57390.1 cytochrome C biosynthesis protein [Lottiidibacillus patelloidae]
MYDFISKISFSLSEPFLNIFYATEGIPLLAAFILGLVAALAPCQFTGNISAITIFGNQSLQKRLAWKEVFFFILGKIVVFSSIGLLVWVLGKEFQQTLTLYFPYFRKVIGPILIILGLFMIGIIKMNWTLRLFKLPDSLKSGRLGSFFMGVSFSIAFCPTMFVLFFITLMPIVLSSSFGVILPSVFAIGTSIPVILTVFLLWYFKLDGRLMKKQGRRLGSYVQKAAGLLMIILGIIDTITYWTI